MALDNMKTSAILVQVLATFSLAYLTSLTGFIYAWPSYNIELFTSNATYLSEPMTITQVSLLGSLVNIGALVFTPMCGYMVNSLGRKKSAILFGLPFVITWSLVIFTDNVTVVLISMTFAGIGASGQAVTTVYISEICYDSIRGGLTSTTVSGYFFGLMISYIFGGILSYMQVLYVHLTLSVLYMVLLLFLEESPVFYVQKGMIEEAAKSIAFYRRVAPNSKEVEVEIAKIKMQLDPELAKRQEAQSGDEPDVSMELLEAKPTGAYKISPVKFFFSSKSTQRAMTAVLITMTLSIMMGSIVLQVYAEPLLKAAAPSIPSNVAAVVMAADYVVASTLCALIVDKFGRKMLSTYSAIGAGICNILLGLQLIYVWFPAWVTVAIIYAYTFIYTLGAATVPFILTGELFLPEVRGLCNSLSMECMWIINFVTLILFNIILEYAGLGVVFCSFAVVCFTSAIYTFFCLPETRGLSADAVQLLFLKKRNKSVL